MSIKLGSFPIEVFGHPYNDNSQKAKDDRINQHCPFINRECVKPRKSDPKTKVGVCSLGYKVDDNFIPVIICPHRLLEDNVYSAIREEFYPNWKKNNIHWIKEVSMPKVGHIDYVAIEYDEKKIKDFLCIEYQACGTTGSPYQYVKDLLENGCYDLKKVSTDRKKYTFGFNWENEFLKTMMQQVLKKGRITSKWKRKIVFVVQDVAISYINSKVDSSILRCDYNDPIFFLTFKEVWSNDLNKFLLIKDKLYSVDLEGVKKILEGAATEDCPTEKEFVKNIKSKAKKDNIIS